MKLRDARSSIWDIMEFIDIAIKNDDWLRISAFSTHAAECLTTIKWKTKQPKEAAVASQVLEYLKKGHAQKAVEYLSRDEVQYDTGSPTRYGWKTLGGY